MKVLLPTLGSAGDVHPFLAIGQAMQARGHDVEVLTNPVFADVVQQAGLQFHPVGTPQHYAETIGSEKLWHPIDGLGVLWRRMARHAIGPVFQRIAHHAQQAKQAMNAPNQKLVVMAPPLLFGARLAHEKLSTPLVTAYTAATMLRSCENPLTMAQWRVPSWMPRAARAAAWRALDTFKLEPMIAADMQSIRQSLDLPALHQSVFGQWMHSPLAGVTLFPDWFAPAPTDWQPQVTQAGFPLYDGDSEAGLDTRLSQFLDEGAPPVVFTPGSAMGHGQAFFHAAVQSCVALGQRGILLTRDASQLPQALPPSVHHCTYAPFGLLLPRARALVHHGGIGGCAQALRAGLPQLLTPMAFDQFDNAMRLEILGVGMSLKKNDAQSHSMTSQLRTLLASPSMANACKEAALKIRQNNAPASICDLLESVARDHDVRSVDASRQQSEVP
jgi:rhamnosyltransferase subunit B